jgi:aryl-alcohol dehydrogenase
MTIRAAVVESKGAPFTVQDVVVGDLRDDEVLVKVCAAGICHTDLIVRDQWYPVPLPAVLGHEGAGVVERVGAAVRGIASGDKVGMTFNSCGRCVNCARGRFSYCLDFFARNFGASRDDGSSVLSRDGVDVHAHFFGQSSFATHAVATERNVVKIETEIPLKIAAPFGCGIQTGAGDVINVLRAPAGSSIAVFGAGAVGLSAVAAARVVGCSNIIAVDINPARLDVARDLGATETIDARTGDSAELVLQSKAGGVDFTLETSGSPAVFRQAVDCLAPTGVCGLIGAPAFGTEVTFDMNTILVGGRTIRGIVEGDSVPQVFLPTLIALWKDGRFPMERIMRFYDFDQIDEAAQDAAAGRVIKPVLLMDD